MPLKFKWASVEVRDSYDNINHNTFLLTLRLTFGGLDKTGEPDIHDRMLDRIPRHIANLNNGDGIPSEKGIINTGRTVLIKDNIWFFNADGTPSVAQGFQSCTFEHPCIGLAQTQIDTINALSPNANFYLSSGTYNNPAVGTGFTFYNGQNIFGRTSNFALSANGLDRPLINDSLLLDGNNNIENIRVNGQTIRILNTGLDSIPLQVGVLINPLSTGIINISNTEISSTSSTGNVIGFASNSVTSSTLINLNNSAVIASITNLPVMPSLTIAIGAGNLHNGVFNIIDSTISASASDTANNGNIVIGVVNNEQGTINIASSLITSNLNNGNLSAAILNNASLGLGLGIINITESTISATGNGAGLVVGSLNQANNLFGVSGAININQSTISVLSNNGGGTVIGVNNGGSGTTSIVNSSINGSADSGSLFGIVNSDPASTVNYQNTTISLNPSGTAVATPTANGGTLNDNGGNQCFVNGALVPC
ncbi:Uncharacterised protein [Legionella lansingensis]|uniref:Uncharacterized protein n=2 Tax=Legionella lansingensis TaxID=45067 RepID=A0A0W0VEJ6_9GAMM|nr:hypothetical protein [Legionella lansingensis]KTD18572.1 hypothetical protein Llan_2490 [Legionella lansingensis]SNV49367.1 Uncharacterised protein [Legionella lansingensis]